MATLRTAAMNLLSLAGFRSIRAGVPAVMHDITALLAMAWRQPQPRQTKTLMQPWGLGHVSRLSVTSLRGQLDHLPPTNFHPCTICTWLGSIGNEKSRVLSMLIAAEGSGVTRRQAR
jgi:hypothetical protein